jgi:glyoxylase-like metal-dependent hydrolase (beta-lactamase superfamily II)
MEIHAFSTGSVRLKESFLHARTGPLRQPALFMPGDFSGPYPIHAWLVEHDGKRILVDTGETAAVNDIPFAKFEVAPKDELDAALRSLNLTPADLDTVLLTHMHGDHMDGAVHLGDTPVLVTEAELAHSKTVISRFFSRVLRQPIPEGIRFETHRLDDGPFGAFAASRKLTDDGRVLAVATPGHTPGHISVLCIDDDGNHLLLAGDATDSLEQLRARRADAIGPKPAVYVETIDRILAHGREHPTVFLPSHDTESVARLEARTTL